MDIVKKMKEAFEPVKPSTRRVVLTVNSEGETVKFVSGQGAQTIPRRQAHGHCFVTTDGSERQQLSGDGADGY